MPIVLDPVTGLNDVARFPDEDDLIRQHIQILLDQYGAYIDAQSTLKANKLQPAWVPATLVNGWTNFGAPYETVSYMIDTLGFIHLKGVASAGTKTGGTIIFTLPVGFRPNAKIMCIGVTGGLVEQIYINADGTVVVGAISGSYFSFDSIPPFKAGA
jgi:hypothetical protein